MYSTNSGDSSVSPYTENMERALSGARQGKPGLTLGHCCHPVQQEWAETIRVPQSKHNSRGGKVRTDTVWFKAGKWAAALTLLNGVSWKDPWAWPSSTRLQVFAKFVWGGRRAGGMFSRGKKKKTLTRLKLSVAREGQGKFRKTPFYVLYDVYSVAQSQERDEKGCRAMRGCKSCVYLIGWHKRCVSLCRLPSAAGKICPK